MCWLHSRRSREITRVSRFKYLFLCPFCTYIFSDRLTIFSFRVILPITLAHASPECAVERDTVDPGERRLLRRNVDKQVWDAESVLELWKKGVGVFSLLIVYRPRADT